MSMINTTKKKLPLGGRTGGQEGGAGGNREQGLRLETKRGGAGQGWSLTHSITTIIFHEERDVLTLPRRHTTSQQPSHQPATPPPPAPTRHPLHLHDGAETPESDGVTRRPE